MTSISTRSCASPGRANEESFSFSNSRQQNAGPKASSETCPPRGTRRRHRQRWNSFHLNTPNVVNVLPDNRYEGEAALGFVRPDPDQPWDAEQLEAALAPFYEEYGEIVLTPDARRAHHTATRATGPRTWDVAQVIVDPLGDNLWALHGAVDLRGQRDPEGPLVALRRIGT